MHDPFHLPRCFQRDSMVNRSFATRDGPLRIWVGLLRKNDARACHFDVQQDSYSALWLLRGDTLYRDREVGEVQAGPGDLICRLPDHRHSTIPVAGSGLVEFFVDLDVGWFRHLRVLGAVPDKPVTHLGWDRGLADRCLMFLDRLPLLPETSWPQVLAEVQAILAAFAIGCARGGMLDAVMAEACTIMEADLTGELSVAAVADRVGLGAESFRKRFSAAIGESPGAWRIRRRIDVACTLLLRGCPLASVATELGYADIPCFAKQFRRVTGQPPAAWRRGQRGY